MHKHKEKSKAHAWGPWSEWAFDENHGRYYRVRQDVNGNYDYDWDTRQTTPREVEELTEDFRNLSPGSAYEGPYEGQTGEYTMASSSKDKKSGSKSKGRSKHRSHHDGGTSSRDMGSSSAAGVGYADYDDEQYNYGQSPADYYMASPSDPRAAPTYSMSTSSYAAGSQSQIQIHEPEDDEIQAAVAASRGMYYDHTNSGESSAAAYGAYYEDDEGPPTPKARITADEEMLDALDPRYRVEHSTKFQPGEIFKVHWSEPQGSGNEHAPSVSGRQEIQNRFGTKFFVGFRRFVVIANDLGHSTCVPILTYGGKGCKKRGVKPAKHGIIYERGHKARLLDGEPKLGFPPVRVEMTEEGEKLSRESRVNYSKLVTVEHNVKVFFIGTIAGNDWDIVQDAVNRCWSEKNHSKKRSK